MLTNSRRWGSRCHIFILRELHLPFRAAFLAQTAVLDIANGRGIRAVDTGVRASRNVGACELSLPSFADFGGPGAIAPIASAPAAASAAFSFDFDIRHLDDLPPAQRFFLDASGELLGGSS